LPVFFQRQGNPHRVTTTRTLATGCLLATLAHWACAAPQPYRMEPAPAWVIEAPDAPLRALDVPVEAGQSDFPLVDHQVRLEGDVTTHYERYAERLVSQTSVDESAQISIDIDPERELILLHQVRVFRNGRVVDKLADSRRSLLSREEDLEHGIINGRVTLHILLQDVRVGDVLDYSYSTVRTDPVDERQYFSWFSTQWGSPARHFHLSVQRQANRNLHILDLGGLREPRETRQGDWLDTTWEGRDIAALPDEGSRPRWHIRYPRIEISEFGTWNEVRAWAMPHYTIAARQGAAFDALLGELRAEPDPSTRILRALRFVQDDIRYTGLEIGAGAWTPSPPARVLARRYGDCKDKVLLLVALLRAMDVEAWPVLVNSEVGRGVRARLPNPGAFDHAIAKVRWKQRDYWLDATVSGQGGTLDTLVQADFGPALVLASDANGLEDIPARDGRSPSSTVVETYDFRRGTRQAAEFTVHTSYREDDADGMRVKIRTNTAAELGKGYLDYYRKSYHGIRMLRPLKIHDDRARNEFEVEESYEISKPFQVTEKGPKFYLEAYLISDRTRKPDETLRTSPLARDFPMHVHHEVIVYLPGGWTISNDDVKVVDKAFEYVATTRFSNGKLDMVYDLRNTRDHVPVDELDEFLIKLDKVHDDAYFTLTDRHTAAVKAAPPTPVKTEASRAPSIVMVIGLLVGLGLGIRLALYYWRLDQPARTTEPYAPEGLGGWMILPSLQVVIGPPALILVGYAWAKDLGSDAVFKSLPLLNQYLVFAIVLLVAAMLVLSLAQLVLLFKRRNSFPRLFILLKAAYLVLGIFSLSAVSASKAGDSIVWFEIRTLAATLVSVAIWVPYMLSSGRVAATFVRGPDTGDDYRRTRVPGLLGAETGP
jgi:transglutaminase-like putative cysteine protease